MSGSGSKAPSISLDAEERELIRSVIMADPEVVLADDMVMRALIGSSAKGARNIVDLRDKLVERLEDRLRKLTYTNRSVIAAAYENVAGTRQVHRAVLTLIDAHDLESFLKRLVREVPRMVGVDEVRVGIESAVEDVIPADELAEGVGGRVLLLPVGFTDDYLAADRPETGFPVVLRECGLESEILFGPGAIRSEAVLRLELGEVTGLLAFGASDPERFSPDQGVDLLTFLAAAIERLMTRLMAEPG